MKIVLLQNFFHHPQRHQEHLFCMRKNDENPWVDQIILAVDKKSPAAEEAVQGLRKTVLMETGREREKYADMFRLTEKNTDKGDLAILANLDIFFDQTLSCLRDFTEWDKAVMALSRWNYLSDGSIKPFKMDNSQDVWVWRTPLNTAGMHLDFALGEPGCDNRIAYELARNYHVVNPCKTIKSLHCHQFECPDYTMVPKVPPPYKTVPRTTLKGAVKQCRRACRTAETGKWSFFRRIIVNRQ